MGLGLYQLNFFGRKFDLVTKIYEVLLMPKVVSAMLGARSSVVFFITSSNCEISARWKLRFEVILDCYRTVLDCSPAPQLSLFSCSDVRGEQLDHSSVVQKYWSQDT